MLRRSHRLVAAGRRVAVTILALGCVLAVAPAAPAAEPLYKETYLVSTSSEDAIFGEDASFEAISKDGLRAFWSTEESLLSTDSDNDNVDIYARIDNKTTQLVTPGGDEDATFLAASEDGSKVFFYLGDFGTDIYRRDLDADPPETTNMTPGTSEIVRFRAIDTSGERMFFETGEPLVGDGDNETDVYMSSSGAITGVTTAGDEPCHANFRGSTPDGQHVFFLTSEVLDAGDGTSDPPGGACDPVFSDRGTPDIHRWSNGSITNITPQGACAPGAGAACAADRFAWSSPDGQRVIFVSTGIFVSGRYQGWCLDDVFQAFGGSITRLSNSPHDGTPEHCTSSGGYYPAQFLGASEDAQKVFWVSREPSLGGDPERDIFLSTNGSSGTLMTPGTSQDLNYVLNTPDGDHLFFATSEPVVDDGDTFTDVFQVHGGTTSKVTKGPLGGNGPSNSYVSATTDDAKHIFFTTGEALTTDDLDETGTDLFDRRDGDTELISTGPLADSRNFGAVYNGTTENADRVFFSTYEKLVPEDTDNREDVYMRWRGDRSLAPGPTVRVDEFALDDDFVELHKTGGTEMPPEDQFPDQFGPYRIVAYDGDGTRIGGRTISTGLLRNQFRLLFSDTHTNASAPLGFDLPAVGQLCFTQGGLEYRISCVAWGCIASPVQAGITRVAAPPPALSQQRQGSGSEVFHVATPTPGVQNVAGTVQEPCPGTPDPGPDPQPDDPPAPPAPNPPAPPPPTPPPFGGAGPLVPLNPSTIVTVTPLVPQEGSFDATCPAELGAACAVDVTVREAASGARARASRAGDVLAQGSTTLAAGQRGSVDVTFTDAGKKVVADLKTVPTTVTVTVAAGGRTATATTASKLLPNLGTDPAKLQIQRAGVKNGRLDVLARITRRASGDVRVAYQAAGRTTRFDATIRNGTLRIARRLPSSQRRTRTGIVTFEWRGNDRVRPTEVRLRAATRKAQLRRRSLSVTNGRLRVSGTISSRVRGVVRLRVGYIDQGEVKTWTGSARISRGRWSASGTLPAAARDDGYLSIQFTGDRRARGGPVRGEQDGKAL